MNMIGPGKERLRGPDGFIINVMEVFDSQL